MNLARGLFRLWLVFSVLFVIGTGAWFYPEIAADLGHSPFPPQEPGMARHSMLPLDCGKPLRGVENIDWIHFPANVKGEPPPRAIDYCWYYFEKFRALYPEYKDLSDEELTRATYRAAGMEVGRAGLRETAQRASAIALGVPLAVLAVGASLFWGAAGFRQSR